MKTESVPWLTISGFGGHIKATTTTLSIHYCGKTREYPLASIKHLLIVGGHTLHTSAVTHLLRAGSAISFFDADGTPTGMLRPFGYKKDEQMQHLQSTTPTYTFACEIARTSLKSRLLMIERTCESLGRDLFYEGEQDFLHDTLNELENLIKMDELRRVHKLASDMYYEIMSRSISPELEFRRRTRRPHQDPVNAMLSIGYALLFGNCCVPVVGACLDPDLGALAHGERSLVSDLIDPLKPRMVDEVVFSIARRELRHENFECGTKRCHLDESIKQKLITGLHKSIDQKMIDSNILHLTGSLQNNESFQIIY